MPITQDRMIAICGAALAQRQILSHLKTYISKVTDAVASGHQTDLLQAIHQINYEAQNADISPESIAAILMEEKHFQKHAKSNTAQRLAMERRRRATAQGAPTRRTFSQPQGGGDGIVRHLDPFEPERHLSANTISLGSPLQNQTFQEVQIPSEDSPEYQEYLQVMGGAKSPKPKPQA